jgi:D-xylose 1-dehydrogenase (NADP+, D-xylono-1,5-lactone-forming)
VRLALLSTARINEKFVAGAREAQGVEIVAVGSRDLARAEAQAARLGIPRAHGSYEELLRAPDVDAVYIAVPNSLHVEWSVRALEAGKHVLCEKPLSRRAEDVARAFDAAERAGRVLVEAFMWRHHPQTYRLEQLAAEIGGTRLIRAAFSFPLDRPGDIRLSAALDGGALMDVGCYCVSAARLFAGEPTAVTAEQVVGGDGVDVRMAATMRFADGAIAHFDCGLDVALRDELEIVGPDGALFCDDPWFCVEPGIDRRDAEGASERIEVPARDPYGCELEDFAVAVAGGREPRFGARDAVGQARAIEALYESAASGRVVEL